MPNPKLEETSKGSTCDSQRRHRDCNPKVGLKEESGFTRWLYLKGSRQGKNLSKGKEVREDARKTAAPEGKVGPELDHCPGPDADSDPPPMVKVHPLKRAFLGFWPGPLGLLGQLRAHECTRLRASLSLEVGPIVLGRALHARECTQADREGRKSPGRRPGVGPPGLEGTKDAAGRRRQGRAVIGS